MVKEITGRVLTSEELQLFSVMYMSVEYRLCGVDPMTLPESLVGDALSLTFRLESACIKAGISLLNVFPCISAAHNYFLEIRGFKFSVKLVPVFYRLSDAICGLLHRALDKVNEYKARGDWRPASPLSRAAKSSLNQFSEGELCDDIVLWEKVTGNVPEDILDVLTDIDGDVDELLAHLKWYVEACRETIYIDTANFTDDIYVRRLWNSYVGKGMPACFAESCSPALSLLPKCLHEPVMDVLNYRDCGVISLYSLKRLLDIWGPFLLLGRNMKDDVAMGVFDFGHSLEYRCKTFARREDAREGDYVLMLSNVPSEVLALVLVQRRGAIEQQDPGECKRRNRTLAVKRIRFTQSSGAWVPDGLTVEEFDSIGAACRAFPEVFQRPCGTQYDVEQCSDARALVDSGIDNDMAHNVSSLHRACFRNNVRYVKTLLSRGVAVIVNTSIIDPVVSSRYCWTPLLCAVNNPNSDPSEVVQMLLNEGADAYICDNAKCTALYYAIANGYAEAARILLKHFPDLRPSPWTESLLVALGAHHFHAHEGDIRRLADLIPSAAMMRVLLPRENNLRFVQLCVDIIAGKLCGVDRLPRPEDDITLWHPDGDVELRTVEEEEYLTKIVFYHGVHCRENVDEVSVAAQLLYHRCYYLSCREHFGLAVETPQNS
ncbi:hypothetical protein, conserved [Trypanosoma brucei gambiense DAL972]|nr:hypothetical protein, conserved [Trypanosoma brucei gambiense DAL972]CBH10234.1 hypothetical protein, conserved [Trypanosoma brucei gambiense DAL972]|eukprot:XP_011772524.1 hypothetical protein, conserved [Trypanosoma brucei gambiense DAL972]